MTEGMYGPASGYEDITIVDNGNGPVVEGTVPDRIGCYQELLDGLVPALGEFDPGTGRLRLLDMWWQQVGVDGTDVVVFDRRPA